VVGIARGVFELLYFEEWRIPAALWNPSMARHLPSEKDTAIMNLWPTVKLCTFKYVKCLKVLVVISLQGHNTQACFSCGLVPHTRIAWILISP
jgi:hypothetical protein